jgi:hypothetical protein
MAFVVLSFRENSFLSTSLAIQLKPFRFYEIWGMFSMTVASDLYRSAGAPLKIPPILGVLAFTYNGLCCFVIWGEQLSLNVAGDSAKTLSVLRNMGDVLDDCGLRFVQKCRRPPQNTPDFGGPILKKSMN